MYKDAMFWSRKPAYIIFCLLFAGSFSLSAMELPKSNALEPWSVSAKDPTISHEISKAQSDKYKISSSPYVFFFWWMSFYRFTYATSEGSCAFTPPCSEYMKQAIIKHGILLGLVIGFERLLRYHHDYENYPTVKVGKAYRLYDPIKNNDFWF
jgi:putative component of membrane protein insertase Oxa1/YidC/SpoIIIJ protein YidD